jgi:hypothetical protein
MLFKGSNASKVIFQSFARRFQFTGTLIFHFETPSIASYKWLVTSPGSQKGCNDSVRKFAGHPASILRSAKIGEMQMFLFQLYSLY